MGTVRTLHDDPGEPCTLFLQATESRTSSGTWAASSAPVVSCCGRTSFTPMSPVYHEIYLHSGRFTRPKLLLSQAPPPSSCARPEAQADTRAAASSVNERLAVEAWSTSWRWQSFVLAIPTFVASQRVSYVGKTTTIRSEYRRKHCDDTSMEWCS